MKAEADAELEPLWQRVYRVQESAKHERYCREQRELLRALEDLAASERGMQELDNRKDQIMTGSLLSCHLCSCNLAALAPIFSVAWSSALGPGGGPGRTAAFQQSSTEP